MLLMGSKAFPAMLQELFPAELVGVAGLRGRLLSGGPRPSCEGETPPGYRELGEAGTGNLESPGLGGPDPPPEGEGDGTGKERPLS